MTHSAEAQDPNDILELRPFPWAWVIATLLCAVAAVATLAVLWSRVPDPMPIHWGARGLPDNWTQKSFPAAAGLVSVLPAVLSVCAAGAAVLVRSTAKNAGTGFPKLMPVEINRARATYNLMAPALGRMVFVLSAFCTATITADLVGLGGFFSQPWILLLVIGLVMVWFLWQMALGQREIDRAYPHPDGRKPLKWGFVYYDKDDPRMLIDDSGMNSTFNFAHKGSWAVMAGLCVPMIVIIAVVALAS